ncbi:hypothetical protein IMX07_09910 [bacterium]|nr:hypothetical protein [bacterium]
MSADANFADEPALALDATQRDALLPQLDAFLGAVADPAARAPYAALRAAVADREVPAQLAERLGAILELALTSGRARAAHGPGAELALWSLFQKTPRGREIAASIGALNAALAPFAGRTLEAVAAAARGPGAYALTIRAEGVQATIRFEPAGVRIENLEIG